jgi:hypothetical protein
MNWRWLRYKGRSLLSASVLIEEEKRAVMLANFCQLMNARWLRRLSDLSQCHRTSLKYRLRCPVVAVLWPNGFVQNRRIESGLGSQLVALPSMAAMTLKAGTMLRRGKWSHGQSRKG